LSPDVHDDPPPQQPGATPDAGVTATAGPTSPKLAATATAISRAALRLIE
jgi:hypothetical protein